MSRAAEVSSVELPKSLGIWVRSDEVRKILPAKIFDYMDGAGELYLGYRFKYLEVAEYSAPEEGQVLVELYHMESSDDAFGLLSGDWGGQSMELVQGRTADGQPKLPPESRALYGAGLLRIWSDDLYVRIMAYRESERSKEAVLRLGRLIAAGRRNPPPPAFLGALPRETASGLRLRLDRLCYFRSHLVLNSIYFLSTKNILDLSNSAEAATASYSFASDPARRRPVQLILVRYENEDVAKRAMVHFEQAYIPEKSKSAPKLSSGGVRFLQIEDGWLGYGRSGRALALVFECPERDLAVQMIGDAIARINHLEVRHE